MTEKQQAAVTNDNEQEPLEHATDSSAEQTQPVLTEEPEHSAAEEPNKKSRNGVAVTALVFSLLSFAAIILGLFAVTMVWPEWQKNQQQFAEFSEQFQQRQQASVRVFEQLTTTNQNQQQSLDQFQTQLADSMLSQQRMEQRLQQLDGRKSNEWLLAEVDYLIRLATRKLWMERDVNGAKALLKSADLRVAELRDPQLLSLRRSLSNDIATLGALPRVDIDGIALTLDGLISQLDMLPLNALEIPDSVGPQNAQTVTNDPSDWRQNLMQSWRHFVDGFIAVNRRADGATPLLPPEQRWYLRANIRLTLQQAQLAALRNQPQLYANAINQSDDWLREYFDNSDSAVQYVREALAELAISPVRLQLPGDLESRQLIRSLLATEHDTSGVTNTPADEQSDEQAPPQQTEQSDGEQPVAESSDVEPTQPVEAEPESAPALESEPEPMPEPAATDSEGSL
ncbi:uroporphyrinogen-III C-methyltransferase [Neiella sp. HB171785]|uniref:Uroporphyrinogen-III C-methyltransferase n=1 Tax=Neiella litorisoli TaxID=2771431 RepID=A0A8J6QTJ6_9GAMM|nr:uroporphyrinogen-III C-methyltransferase [Neiella litorisoli]MBD1388003.1 uroporphyrinogen-III C-methyltransferase [Neiella litorisoli]